MKLRRALSLGIALVSLLALPAALSAQDGESVEAPRRPAKSLLLGIGSNAPIEVLYTDLPGDPTADVPGLPGAHFSSFDRPYGSSVGSWVITADTDLTTDQDEILFSDDVVLVREGTPTPWNPGELFGLLDQQVAINAAGHVVFATNTNGPTTADEYAVVVPAGLPPEILAQEGQPMPFLAGATWGTTIESPVLSDGNVPGISTDNIGGLPTTENEVIIANGNLQAQEGVTVPTGQVGTEFWENFDVTDLWIDSAGTSWLVQGDLTGDTALDDVVGVDGEIVIQEGSILANSTFAEPVDLNGIVGVHMARNGTWYARGNNAVSEQDWIYSDGAVLTKTGDPIFTGATEVWTDAEFADCFFLHIGDGLGNYVLGGVSNGPTPTNGLLVLNNAAEIVREGDAFDLDGNGQFDDDTYFNTFGNDDGYLTDDGWFYFVATIRDGAGTPIGDGFFRADVSCLIMPFTDGFESGDTSAWCLTVE
ncbi:MAG TPA: hypothetical protein VLA66_11045 [Thermoanaerobaculia bacterium]|nr:hypothetical protein [Thermoanaerobaculia bacterium]